MKLPSPSFLVSANYEAMESDFEYDSVVRGLVGRPEKNSSWDSDTRVRMMDFVFDNKNDAKKALTRLRNKKIKAEIVKLLE